MLEIEIHMNMYAYVVDMCMSCATNQFPKVVTIAWFAKQERYVDYYLWSQSRTFLSWEEGGTCQLCYTSILGNVTAHVMKFLSAISQCFLCRFSDVGLFLFAFEIYSINQKKWVFQHTCNRWIFVWLHFSLLVLPSSITKFLPQMIIIIWLIERCVLLQEHFIMRFRFSCRAHCWQRKICAWEAK